MSIYYIKFLLIFIEVIAVLIYYRYLCDLYTILIVQKLKLILFNDLAL